MAGACLASTARRPQKVRRACLAESFIRVDSYRKIHSLGKRSQPSPVFGLRHVVQEGERDALWDRTGRVSFIDGPSSRYRFGSGWSTLKLRRHVATDGQFLVVHAASGESRVHPGPTTEWEHPIQHERVDVFEALQIGTNEAIVVYSKVWPDVLRSIVHGPTAYVPQTADDWVHEFCWHGSDQEAARLGLNRKRAGALRFKKLRLVPDQLYFDVEKVRTKNDALLTVKVMIFYELLDPERMVDHTHDPVSDLINTLTADVIELTSSMLFEEFRAGTDRLNRLETYPTLTAAASRIGFKVTRVVFRGYEASEKLQMMHDAAIEERTGMRLTQEKEAQEQELMDFRQDKEQRRTAKEREEEGLAKQHEVAMAELAEDAKLRADQKEHEQRVALTSQSDDAKLSSREKEMRAMEKHYEALASLGVDLTQHLGQKVDRIIRLEGSGISTPPQLHIGDGAS